MKTPKPKPGPRLRDKLSESFLRAFVSDFEDNGIEAIEKLRTRNPAKYCEISARLIAANEPDDGLDFKSAKTMQDIGLKLLKSVGVQDAVVTDEMVQAAIEANNAFIATLEAIRDRHEHTDGEIH